MNIKPGNNKIFINKQKKEENKMSEILKLTINDHDYSAIGTKTDL